MGARKRIAEKGKDRPAGRLTRNPDHDNGLTSVVSIMSPVMAGGRRRGRERQDKQQHNEYLFHFCSFFS
jgi:hypothetical protein